LWLVRLELHSVDEWTQSATVRRECRRWCSST